MSEFMAEEQQPGVKAKQNNDDTEGHLKSLDVEAGFRADEQPSAHARQHDEDDDTEGHKRADW